MYTQGWEPCLTKVAGGMDEISFLTSVLQMRKLKSRGDQEIDRGNRDNERKRPGFKSRSVYKDAALIHSQCAGTEMKGNASQDSMKNSRRCSDAAKEWWPNLVPSSHSTSICEILKECGKWEDLGRQPHKQLIRTLMTSFPWRVPGWCLSWVEQKDRPFTVVSSNLPITCSVCGTPDS